MYSRNVYMHICIVVYLQFHIYIYICVFFSYTIKID
jgi:hypothetical protein